MRSAARVGAALLALGGLVPLWWGSGLGLILLLAGAQRPDASVPDGDPCCVYPDDWGQVVLAVSGGLILIALAIGLLLGMSLLAGFAARGRRARITIRRWATAALVWAAGVAILWLTLTTVTRP